MKFFLDHLLRNAEGGSGGGAGDGAGAAAAAAGGAAAAAAPPANAADASGAASAAAGAAAAAGGSPPPAAVDIYKPEGLADHMLGKSNTETIDNLAKAVQGYRERDAANNVPEKPEAYAEFTDLPEPIKPHVETLKNDKLFERVAAKAHEMKVSLPVFQALTTEMMSAAAEIGLLEPPIDYAAEKTALVPDSAKHLPPAEQAIAREKRMNENFAYIDAMVARAGQEGGLSKDAAEYAKAMLGDTARGHEFFEFFRKTSSGGQGAYTGGNTGGGTDHRAELERRASLPENTWGNKNFDRASYDQLDADRKKFHGD